MSPEAPASDRDHHRALGLRSDASPEMIRAAYVRLIKRWHPDVNPAPRAHARFQRITEAYRALTVVEADHADWHAPEQRELDTGQVALAPLRCDRCGDLALQPRHIRFPIIVSALVYSWRRYDAGNFCPDCARKEALRASLITGLLGWWSVQGPFRVPKAILRNARGGEVDFERSLRLIYHNLLAYRHDGEGKVTAELGHLIKTSRQSLSLEASLIIASLPRHEPAATDGPDPWSPRLIQTLQHLLCGAFAPLTALFVAQML
jgi:hypothetical protein